MKCCSPINQTNKIKHLEIENGALEHVFNLIIVKHCSMMTATHNDVDDDDDGV